MVILQLIFCDIVWSSGVKATMFSCFYRIFILVLPLYRVDFLLNITFNSQTVSIIFRPFAVLQSIDIIIRHLQYFIKYFI